MAQLNSLVVTGNSKFISDVNANNIITGTETVNNQLYVKYKSGSWVNSLTNSAVVVPDQASSFGGWICGPTASGRIVISTYQASDNKLYFGYGERGRTTNSYTKQMTWDGPTNTLTADKFVGALQGNADTATKTTLLKPIATNTSTEVSNWSIPSGSYQVWGQRWTDNRLKYTPSGGSETTITDSGDFTMWLTGSTTSNMATLNMRIDGTFYASGGFNGSLAGNASTATKATQDSDGNAINTTYLKLSGGTLTGRVKHNNVAMPLSGGKITNLSTGTTEIFKDGIAISNPATANDVGFIRVLGTGESDAVLEIATGDDAGAGEQIVFRQYNTSNAIGREAKIFDTAGNTSFPGKLTVSKAINELLTGTGTTAQDKGSGVSPRYFPAKWTFNKSIATPSDGDMITIKIPCAGHDFGVFISLDNGTTYKPVGLKTQDNGRLTTHYPNGRIITLMYDSTAVVDQVFAAAGADSRSNITGAWKVVTSYLDGNTYDRNVFGWTNIKAWGTALTAGNIIVGINGVFHHLKEGTAFDITYPILYLNANVGANGTQSNIYDCLNFTITTTQSITLTQFLPVYIKGTLDGTTFTPVSTTPLTQIVPTTADGYTYIELGIASSTTAVYMEHRHKILRYLNGKFGEVVNAAANWANYAASAGTASTARKIVNDTIRMTTADTAYSDAGLRYYLASSSMTTNKPPYDGQIIHAPWDTTAGWATQLCLGHSSSPRMCIRGQEGATWGSWYPIGVFSQTAPTSGQVVVTDGTLGGIKSSGYTIAKSVPSNADFTNTWRPVQDNLTSDSATDSLSAKQGKALANGSARDNTKLPLAGGTMTGGLSCTTSGANLSWGNFYVYGAGANGGIDSLLIGDDVYIGDCNVGGCFGMRPRADGGTTAGIAFYNNAKTSIGRIQSANGTLQWVNASGTVYNLPLSDTKNTAGSTDTSSKIFLIGATSQAANPQTYSDNEIYATSGVLTTKSVQVGGTAATMQYNSTNHCIDFVVT